MIEDGPNEVTIIGPVTGSGYAAIHRLNSLVPLDAISLAALDAAASESRTVLARRELVSESMPVGDPMLVLEGWAARVRQLSDGRRQILSFLLPGDLVGHHGYEGAVAATTIVAFTDIRVCRLPPDTISPSLGHAYAIARSLDEGYLLAQITRLGRLNAYERIVDFLLEILERLSSAGMDSDGAFIMPLTQETLADTLGLTSVHVNRMLQQGRRAGDFEVTRSRVRIRHADALARVVGRHSRVQVAGRPADADPPAAAPVAAFIKPQLP